MPTFSAALPPTRTTGDAGPANDVNALVAAIGEIRALLNALGGVGIVIHGSVAATARPDTTGPVIWLGTVRPTNLADGDVWLPIAAES